MVQEEEDVSRDGEGGRTLMKVEIWWLLELNSESRMKTRERERDVMEEER